MAEVHYTELPTDWQEEPITVEIWRYPSGGRVSCPGTILTPLQSPVCGPDMTRALCSHRNTLNILKDKPGEKTAGGNKSTRILATNNPLWRQLQYSLKTPLPFMEVNQGQAGKFRCFPHLRGQQPTAQQTSRHWNYHPAGILDLYHPAQWLLAGK